MSRARLSAPDTPTRVRLPDGAEKPVPDEMTLDDFMRFPWPEDQHWELIWGSPIMTPSPIPFHQSFVGELLYWMRDHLKKRTDLVVLQDEDVLLPRGDNYLRPDISIFRKADVDMAKVPVRALPLLVVEVLSPSTASRDWGDKKEAFADAGVPEYWIADPASGALSILHEPKEGVYAQQYADAEGFLASPFFSRRVRIRFDGHSYAVEDKPLP